MNGVSYLHQMDSKAKLLRFKKVPRLFQQVCLRIINLSQRMSNVTNSNASVLLDLCLTHLD